MAIDLNSCNGCNACVVACVSENNTPVVGKRPGPARTRNAWIRIDRYYNAQTATNDPRTNDNDALANPETFFQPVPCMQCENAPCEQVCRWAPRCTARRPERHGLQRCSAHATAPTTALQGAPLQFPALQDWETPQLKLMRNPEVTVRSRGVMEKCTYCVQRINNARIEAESRIAPSATAKSLPRAGVLPLRGHHFPAMPTTPTPASQAQSPAAQLQCARRTQHPPAYHLFGSRAQSQS